MGLTLFVFFLLPFFELLGVLGVLGVFLGFVGRACSFGIALVEFFVRLPFFLVMRGSLIRR